MLTVVPCLLVGICICICICCLCGCCASWMGSGKEEEQEPLIQKDAKQVKPMRSAPPAREIEEDSPAGSGREEERGNSELDQMANPSFAPGGDEGHSELQIAPPPPPPPPPPPR